MEKLYKVSEICEMLGLAETTIRRKIQLGEIASMKIGRNRRVPESALREYLAKEVAKSDEFNE